MHVPKIYNNKNNTQVIVSYKQLNSHTVITKTMPDLMIHLVCLVHLAW